MNARLVWKLVFALLLFAIVGPTGVAPAAEGQTIAEINAAIQATGGEWVARENPIFLKSPEERRRLLGALEESAGPEAAAAPPPVTAIPAAYDWRNVGGKNYVTPVRNQGSCGSCWAFSTTAALESKFLITAEQPGTNLDLSEQIVLSCSGAGDCSGGYVGTASSFLTETGTAVESCYPYTATDGSCSSACSDWQMSAYYFQSWAYVNSGEVATSSEIKNAIYSSGPVVAGMRVYSDFYSYGSGVYSHSSGTYEGGHAILVVGYDDSQSAFICKNSWGPDWGDSGFFRIAYSQLASDVQFGYWTYFYGSAYGPSSEWTAAYARLFDSDADLSLLRTYRDQVLAVAPLGNDLIKRLYGESDTLLRVLLTQPRLLIQARRLYAANKKALEDAVAQRPGIIKDSDEIFAFLDDLGARSPLLLKTLLHDIKMQLMEHRNGQLPYLGFVLN